jgi:hypothetical protein
LFLGIFRFRHFHGPLHCDHAAITQQSLAQTLGMTAEQDRARLADAIQELDSMRLIWRDDDAIFGLGVPADRTHVRMDRRWKACWGGLYE